MINAAYCTRSVILFFSKLFVFLWFIPSDSCISYNRKGYSCNLSFFEFLHQKGEKPSLCYPVPQTALIFNILTLTFRGL